MFRELLKFLFYNLNIDKIKKWLRAIAPLSSHEPSKAVRIFNLDPPSDKLRDKHIIIFAATCDYFERFGEIVHLDLLSTNEHVIPHYCLILRSAKHKRDLHRFKNLITNFSGAGGVASYSICLPYERIKDKKSLLNCARYFVADNVLRLKPSTISIADIDIRITDCIDSIIANKLKPVRFRERRALDSRFYVCAGFISILNSPIGRCFLKHLLATITSNLHKDDWFLDQKSLFHSSRRYKFNGNLDEKQFGFDPNSISIIWAKKGSSDLPTFERPKILN
ncbi:MAG: hypothetical protein VW124_22105 [Paracoccaceae bacterium]